MGCTIFAAFIMLQKEQKLRLTSFIPAFAWLVICTILLALPGKDLPSLPFLNIPYLDKFVHLAMFLVLSALLCYPLLQLNSATRGKWFIYLTLFALAHGVAMEFVQKHLVRNRSFDIVDIVFDAIGCIAGVLIVWSIGKKIGPDRHRGRNQN